MSGSLSIPNTFATASGSVAASLLDANWTAVASYVNTREITLGLLGSRPAAGVAGRFYFATDNGLLYADTGSTWTQIGQTAVGVSTGVPRVSGLTGANNSGTPTTKFDLAASFVQLRNPADGTINIQVSTGTLTNDVTVATAANGRDQAGAFTASTFVHFYFIWNGTTLATLSSATAPPTGPTLPATYTHWAYAGAVFFGAGSTLTSVSLRGSWVEYQARQILATSFSSTSETTLNVSTCVSANASRFEVGGFVSHANNNTQLMLRYLTTKDYRPITGINTLGASCPIIATLPNVSQQFFAQWSGAVSNTGTIDIVAYQVPNGDS